MRLNLNSKPQWQTLYYRDFSTLDDVDLASGSFAPEKTIDGKIWVVNNSGSAVNIGVGGSYGGIKITPYTGSAKNLYQSGRTACWLYTKLGQFFENTDAYERDDIELRISTRITGTIENYNSFISASSEAIVHGITTPTYAAKYYHLIYQGGFGGTPSHFRVEHANSTTVGLDNVNVITVPSVTHIPNCSRILIRENGLKQYQYCNASASSIDAVAQWDTLNWKSTTITTSPIIIVTSSFAQNTEAMYYFGAHQNSAARQLSDFTLQELKIEWRYSPRGGAAIFA